MIVPTQDSIPRAAPSAPASVLSSSEGLTLAGVHSAWQRAQRHLLAHRTNRGHWVGELSTSALSTATAISALALIRQRRTQLYARRREEIDQAISVACRWLLTEQNRDGGFGDTNLSHSNIATSLLVLAAWQLADFNDPAHKAIRLGWQYCDRVGKWDALRRRYGKDKTFVAPILTNCALAGIVSWDDVPTLPFEAAWLPQSWYRLARLPVVSYAVPALVAIGQAKFHHRPPIGPLKFVRRAAIEPTLRVLCRMQPSSGGYLEAVPLTSFVLMCLADVGRGDHPVAVRAVDFLLHSRLDDGSLPIDTNLATWTTSLAISALQYAAPPNASPHCATPSQAQADSAASARDELQHQAVQHQNVQCVPVAVDPSPVTPAESDRRTFDQKDIDPNGTDLTAAPPPGAVSVEAIRWLLSCQHWSEHPFTGARPGGWGWSNLSGAVPDADDTPAALMALSRWLRVHAGQYPMLEMQIAHAAAQGLRWLLKLQNRDGGWPTFCRGWGKLPFDRSGSDLTAHALRAFEIWRQHRDALRPELANALVADALAADALVADMQRATERGFEFLAKKQNPDGSWFPLWFGNQDRGDEENPVYGTAKVLLAYADSRRFEANGRRGLNYLIDNQNADGGWGGGPSVPYRALDGGQGAGDSHQVNNGQVGSSVEETGAALEALLAYHGANITDSSLAGGGSTSTADATIMRGLRWLSAAVENDCLLTSWPIGFYFAKLWYHERLYPIIASTAALGAAIERPELWLKSP